jgi:DNA-binding NarL/FixJ family response regulator
MGSRRPRPVVGDFPEPRPVSGFTPTAVGIELCDDCDVAQRVLIVDDHAEFRSLARAVLEADGFEVAGEAGDAEGALLEVERTRPDIVLLDVQLPDGNGFDVARSLDGPDGPLVVMTSSRDASDFGTRLAGRGIRGFIPKSRLSGSALAALVD